MKPDWKIKTIGEICEIYNGGTPSTSIPEYWDGGIQWITPKDMGKSKEMYVSCCERTISQEGVEHSSTKVLPERSVIVSSRAPIGYVAINDVPMATNQGCKGFVLGKELYPEFLYYFLLASTELLNKLGTGATFKEVSGKKLAGIKIPVPSIPEQQRIVGILDQEFAKIDALKANAEKSLQEAKDLFQATLKKELEPKEGWEVAEINSVCLKTDNIKWKDIPEEREYAYIDLTSVDRSTKSVVEPQRIRKSNAPSRAQRLVSQDDIIFATTRPTLRRYCIIPEQYDGQICSTGFCVLRPDKRKVRPSWLFHSLSTNTFYDYVEPLQTGATYPAITDKDVKGYVISLPSIAEQDYIISRLDVINDRCNTLQDNYQKTLTLCDDLKQALLRKAFNGEL